MRRLFLPLALCTLAANAQTPAPTQTQTRILHLIPTPRELHPAATEPLPQGLRTTCSTCASDPQDAFTQSELNRALAARRIPTDGPITITLSHTQSLPPEAQPEGYTITPTGSGLTLAATTPAGLFYATQTLLQLIEHDGPQALLHQAQIRDWPAMRYRGMQDDLSRGPVPTLAFQKDLIRTLAGYKVNVYSPYFEHTQQYASNPLPAPPGGSITPAEAREITAYAAQYHVTVIPDQEAFGHLHHNLTWEQYSALAETPHGQVLAPAQSGSLAYIQQIFTELAADYPGPFLHIGADETDDLGRGQTKADVDARGLGPVYLDFVQKIETALTPLHRRILFWGDIAQSIVQGATAYTSVGAAGTNAVDPNLLKNLPPAFKANSIAVAWWYTPHPTKGFASFLNPFTAAGIETWVAPGVNNWSLVWPNSNDALNNIQQFVAEGQRQHSTGVLNTIWYDDGEALANNNWYGLLFGAAASWQPGLSNIADFQDSYAQVFHGDSSGMLNEAQTELMRCHDILRNQAHVGDGSDGLFWMDPWSPDGQRIAPKLRPFAHDLRLHTEHALTLIAQARAANPALLSSRSEAERAAVSPFSDEQSNALPSNPTTLHHPDAIDALELGARRLDFIGLKFQLADEIAQGYTRAQSDLTATDRKQHNMLSRELSDIRGINGRLEDILDTWALLRDLYAQAWLRSNRPYALRPILAHYDATLTLWQTRVDKFRAAQRQYADTKTLPTPTSLDLPLTR